MQCLGEYDTRETEEIIYRKNTNLFPLVIKEKNNCLVLNLQGEWGKYGFIRTNAQAV